MAELIEKACQLCNLCSRVKLPHRSNFIRRLNSAPSPTTIALSNASGKENAYLKNRSPVKPSSLKDGSFTTFLSPRSSAKGIADDDEDSNSQDSGCAEDANNGARFAVPNGFAPRKVFEPSPNKMWTEENATSPSAWKKATLSPSSYRSDSFRSLSFSSTDSFDDGFSELADLDKPDDKAPSSLTSLLTGPLISSKENAKTGEGTPTSFRQPLRRAFSMVENNINNGSDGIDGKLGYKRPRELIGCIGLQKRRKQSTLNDTLDAPRHKLQRSASESAATLNSSTLSKLYGRADLIADYSRPYVLPIITGKHSELTTISPETLAGLINGQFASTVRSYTVIDCRYPYEFEGGHIRGAINLYTSDQLEATLLAGATPSPTGLSGDPSGRDILIFHCEFSQVRAPLLYRWLRRCDRSKSNYPSLQYPEVYLLNGGYQNFFSSHGTLCEPTGYRPMNAPGFENDLRKFRARSSSWSGSRTTFKRLQLN